MRDQIIAVPVDSKFKEAVRTEARRQHKTIAELVRDSLSFCLRISDTRYSAADGTADGKKTDA